MGSNNKRYKGSRVLAFALLVGASLLFSAPSWAKEVETKFTLAIEVNQGESKRGLTSKERSDMKAALMSMVGVRGATILPKEATVKWDDAMTFEANIINKFRKNGVTVNGISPDGGD